MRMKLKAEISVATNLLGRHDLLQVKSFLKELILDLCNTMNIQTKVFILPEVFA